MYGTPERIEIMKASTDVIYEYSVNSKEKNAIDFRYGTGLAGTNLLNDSSSALFLDTS